MSTKPYQSGTGLEGLQEEIGGDESIDRNGVKTISQTEDEGGAFIGPGRIGS